MADHITENLQAFGAWVARPRGTVAKILAFGTVLIALPLLALVFAPSILSMLAPPLDLRQDLYSVNRPIAFTFLDADGNQVGHRGAIVGERLKLDEMPSYLPAAFMAVEDRHFYSHGAVDVHGLLRALWVNFHAHHVVQGGSTITQQTAKIVFLNPKRTYQRKVQELFDAASLEKSLTKDQILELYLNRIYLGSGAYGVDGAAHVYFGKSARKLTLAQAAMLATLTTAPSVYSPRRDLARSQERASLVLDEMVQTHAISAEQAEEAKSHPAVVTNRTVQDAQNFFLDTAADEATRLASTDGDRPTSDLIVHTTLNSRLQNAARRSLNLTLAKEGRRARAHEGAVVVMKPDGAVAALIGGRDYDESMFNRATQAKRQPGSAFKPFVYLAALESGISPWDTRTDSDVDIDGWKPTNYGGRSYGTITLADALAHSVNTITAALGQEVGIGKVIEAAQRLGIKSPLAQNASLTLGTSEVTPVELTAAYAAFANGGLRVQPYMVLEVDDHAGHALYRRQPPEAERVISDQVDRDMVAMLYGVVTQGTGRSAAISEHEAAGKTGTTQDYRDAWFVGFTTDYVTAVWIGNDDSSPMRNVTGGSIPAEVWKSVMTTAEAGLPSRPLTKSEPQAPVDNNGVIADENGEATVENDASSAAGTADEEAGGANVDEDDDSHTSTASSDTPDDSAPKNSRENKGWFDWLFSGSKQSGKAKHEQVAQPAAAPVEAAAPRPLNAAPRRAMAPAATRGSGVEQDVGTDEGIADESPPPPQSSSHPRRDQPPPPPPRSGPAPPPPPDVGDDGAQHPDDGDDQQ